MKKKQVMSVLGAIALTLGVSMNLQYALDDYGMDSNTLSTFVLAQTGSWWGSSSGSGGSGSNGQYYNHPKEINVHCIIHTTTTSTSGSSSSVNGGVSGGVSGGVGNIGGNISGSTGNTNGSSTTTITYKDFYATQINCMPSNNYVEICTPYDPCI